MNYKKYPVNKKHKELQGLQKWLQNFRKERGLSQKDLAEILGVGTESGIFHIEATHNAITDKYIEAFVEKFGISDEDVAYLSQFKRTEIKTKGENEMKGFKITNELEEWFEDLKAKHKVSYAAMSREMNVGYSTLIAIKDKALYISKKFLSALVETYDLQVGDIEFLLKYVDPEKKEETERYIQEKNNEKLALKAIERVRELDTKAEENEKTIEQLNTDKEDMQKQIDGLNSSIDGLNTLLNGKMAELRELRLENARLKARLDKAVEFPKVEEDKSKKGAYYIYFLDDNGNIAYQHFNAYATPVTDTIESYMESKIHG